MNRWLGHLNGGVFRLVEVIRNIEIWGCWVRFVEKLSLFELLSRDLVPWWDIVMMRWRGCLLSSTFIIRSSRQSYFSFWKLYLAKFRGILWRILGQLFWLWVVFTFDFSTFASRIIIGLSFLQWWFDAEHMRIFWRIRLQRLFAIDLSASTDLIFNSMNFGRFSKQFLWCRGAFAYFLLLAV